MLPLGIDEFGWVKLGKAVKSGERIVGIGKTGFQEVVVYFLVRYLNINMLHNMRMTFVTYFILVKFGLSIGFRYIWVGNHKINSTLISMNNFFSNHIKNKVFPACFVEMPSSAEGKRAAFYLAAEEYLARTFPEDNYLFTWQVSPTVVMGRNQVAHLELDLDFCRAEGIDIIRRKSGGGSIYADKGNIMVSVITGKGAVEPLFESYAENVADCLCRLGANVKVSGRNDIVLEGGGKICGNAFYHLKDSNIVHGTMLYDTNYRLMSGALTPDKAKMKSKGVTSVKSRISLLKDELNIEVLELREVLRRQLTDRSIRLTEDDIQYIKAIEADYYTPSYLFGNSVREDAIIQGHVDGCGTISLHFELKGSCIDRIEVKGDYFALGDVQQIFQDAFVNKEFTAETLMDVLHDRHPETSIRGLSLEELSKLISEQCRE